ncbi:hypothetical protein HDU76_000538, partial [Blyttiomyces sp. JEL0837]
MSNTSIFSLDSHANSISLSRPSSSLGGYTNGSGASAIQRPSSALKQVPNINFNPNPTTPGKCPYLKIRVRLGADFFMAGSTLHGWLEVDCHSKSHVKLGEIAVELIGFEEINEQDDACSQSFFSSKFTIQNSRTRPSAAVRGQRDNGFWMANRGKTTFPFTFELPGGLPGSYIFQKLASLRYVVTGLVQFQYERRTDTMYKSREAIVVESLADSPFQKSSDWISGRGQGTALLGGSLPIELTATVLNQRYATGSTVALKFGVRNMSKMKIQGVRVSFVRKLFILRPGNGLKTSSDVRVVEHVESELSLREKDYLFDAGDDRTCSVSINIP